MDKLPNEILDCIFIDLNLFQKQECMLVCRRWSDIIRSNGLLSTVIINNNINLKRLIGTLYAHPSYCYQIRKLIVLNDVSLTFSKAELLDYFPKLRFIHLKDSAIQLSQEESGRRIPIQLSHDVFAHHRIPNQLNNVISHHLPIALINVINHHVPMRLSNVVRHVPILLGNLGDNSSQLTDFNNWINQIEVLEVLEQPLSLQFLSSGVFLGLKILVLTLNNVYTNTDFIAYAPNITSLTMINARISLANLELLQTGLKALQSLTLENAYLMVDRELNDLTTESTITTLSISIDNTDDGTIVIWLQYITKNCALLQNFRFICPWIGYITRQHEENITSNGLVPLLKNLGSRLKHLDISTSFGMHTILRTLDVQNHNIQMLRVSTLFTSDWLPFVSVGELGRYIHELTITLENDSWLKTYDLKEISALKRLIIGKIPETFYRQTSLCLNDILDSCSNSLESLEIYDFNICCFSTDTNSYLLKNLAVHSSSISQSVYKFISYSLPCLDSLTIDERYMSSDGTIMLKDKRFFYLEIAMKDYDYIMINTLSDGISYHYFLGDYEESEFDSPESSNTKPRSLIKRANLEETKGSKTIARLTCKSIETLVINKKIAF